MGSRRIAPLSLGTPWGRRDVWEQGGKVGGLHTRQIPSWETGRNIADNNRKFTRNAATFINVFDDVPRTYVPGTYVNTILNKYEKVPVSFERNKLEVIDFLSGLKLHWSKMINLQNSRPYLKIFAPQLCITLDVVGGDRHTRGCSDDFTLVTEASIGSSIAPTPGGAVVWGLRTTLSSLRLTVTFLQWIASFCTKVWVLKKFCE